jgi:hypothetical protein
LERDFNAQKAEKSLQESEQRAMDAANAKKAEALGYIKDMPELQAALLGAPEVVRYNQLNPEWQKAQLDALARLQSLGGKYEAMSAPEINRSEMANYRLAQLANAQQEQAQRQALAANLAQRGVSTSGMGQAGQLANQQAAAMRGNVAGLEMQKQAQARALEAMQGMGQTAQASHGAALGSQGAQYNIEKNAADRINEFNQWNATAKNNFAQLNRNNAMQQQALRAGTVSGSKVDWTPTQLASEQGLRYQQMANDANMKGQDRAWQIGGKLVETGGRAIGMPI